MSKPQDHEYNPATKRCERKVELKPEKPVACPADHEYNPATKRCERKVPNCTGGKELRGNVCVCPAGKIEKNGRCEEPPAKPAECPPGKVKRGDLCICPPGKIEKNGQCVAPEPIPDMKPVPPPRGPR